MTAPDQTPERVEEIAWGLRGAERMAIVYLANVERDRMPKIIRTEEQMAAALAFCGLSDRRLALSAVDGDFIDWTLTPLGRAVARALDTSKGE